MMQYYTFLGTTKYEEASYFFSNDLNNEYKSCYVQMAIIEKYIDEISDVYIFCTKSSKEANGDELESLIKNKNNTLGVHFIEVDYDLQSSEIIKEMNKTLSQDFILDITNCFRNIPTTVTLISRYLEYSKSKYLKHLYYGNFNIQSKEGLILDLIHQYHDSLLVNDLEAFDRYLKVMVNNNYENSNGEIIKLLKAFDDFNHMIEFCEFDNSIKCVEEIVKYSELLLKNEEKYLLLVPYLNSIKNKFMEIINENNLVLKKIKFIKLLLVHNLVQISMTFTDQLIREELVRYCYFPNEIDFKDKLHNFSIYDLSQDLFFYLGIRISKRYRPNDKVLKFRDKIINNNVDLLDEKSINDFYFKIRNHINHGEEIQLSKEEITQIIDKCLMSLKNLVKGGYDG